MRELKLPAEVADKYTLKDIAIGSYQFPGYGEIDLHNLSLSQADALVQKGFPYLVAKKKKAAAVKDEFPEIPVDQPK